MKVDLEQVSGAVWTTLANRGVEGLTVRAVAAEAGCTTGLIMHHFANRSALLEHARDELYRRTSRRADRAEATSRDPMTALINVLSGSLTLDKARQDEALVWLGFLAAAVSEPALRQLHAERNSTWIARIERLLHAAAPSSNPKARTDAAVHLIALTDGLAALSTSDHRTYSAARQTRVLREAVTNTITAITERAVG